MKKCIIVSLYSITHCFVDMACSMLIAGTLSPKLNGSSKLLLCIFIYNMLAFAFQVPFGIITDKFNKNAYISASGCIFVALAYCISSYGLWACIMTGIGNALFHVSGGVDVLNISDRKASLPGIYVSTGAIGLFIGTKCNYLGFNKFYIMTIILVICAILLIMLYKMVILKNCINNEEFHIESIDKPKYILILCILSTICIRSYLGLILNFSWKANFSSGLITVFAVVLGKILGGIIGDFIGYTYTANISLLLSAVLFIFSFDNMYCGILAILLFNMTMPVTLTILSNTLNKSKGLAFGLTTLALFVGAVPSILGYASPLFNKAGLFTLTIISAILLYSGLKKYNNN